MIHKVKIKTIYLERVKSNEKTFEVRLNDRDYQAGDVLHFEEVKSFGGCSDCSVVRRVTYVHSGLGMEGNYVVLGLSMGGGM